MGPRRCWLLGRLRWYRRSSLPHGRDPNSKSLLTRTTSSLWSYEEVEPAIPERFSHAAVQVAIKNTKNTADAAPEAAVVSKVTPAMLVYGGLNVQEDITDVAAISLRCI